MAGMKSETGNNIACRIWNIYIENKLWVSAAHISGKINIEADQQSTMLRDATEWKLHPELFQKIIDKFGKPGNYLTIFAYCHFLVYNYFYNLEHFSKLETSQSLTYVNKY